METLKVLGQVSPPATTLTPLYTVTTVGASASSLTICNTNGAGTANIRVSIAVGGAPDDVSQYLYYGLEILGSDTFIATIGLSLNNGDVVNVYATQTNITFQLFGAEIS